MADELMTCSGMVTVREMEREVNSMREAWPGMEQQWVIR